MTCPFRLPSRPASSRNNKTPRANFVILFFAAPFLFSLMPAHLTLVSACYNRRIPGNASPKMYINGDDSRTSSPSSITTNPPAFVYAKSSPPPPSPSAPKRQTPQRQCRALPGNNEYNQPPSRARTPELLAEDEQGPDFVTPADCLWTTRPDSPVKLRMGR